ncbi:glycosyltransferase family 9 protein [Actinocorallia populi]|uniref:glycosyltransferase family 9 protein n=1 Tax=Actinocorallia populi TaxID=2079200 RepID=UPI000D0974AC|nr:glycosyltransferase family 9 protein [Actinocorallia populi]
MSAVLILRALGLGDFLTGVPAYRALAAAHPGREIVLAAPGVLAPLVPLTGALDRLLPTGELRPIPWRGPPPRLAVDLHGNGPASHRLIAATGARGQWMYGSQAAPDVAGPWWREEEHETARWCRLLRWHCLPADPSDLLLERPAVAPPVVDATVVHPGAAHPSRRWPAGRFAEVAAVLEDAGHRVVLTGGARERLLAERVAELAALPEQRVLAGRLDLSALAALVAAARLVVSGDTGVAHLAFAYARPSVTLYGPVSPRLWGPPEHRRHRVIWHGQGGRPGDARGRRPDARLLSIGVPEVVEAALSHAPVR